MDTFPDLGALSDTELKDLIKELTEEEVKAFVVPRDNVDLDFAELREFAAQRLSAFKVPRFWEVIEALPRTPTARVAKHRLPAGHTGNEYDASNDGKGER